MARQARTKKSARRTRRRRSSPPRTNTADAVEIPNQVFLAVPWKTVRPKYEAVVERLRRRYPRSFVIVGREGTQDAEDLLEVIKAKLMASSYVVFDATGGNANVSLEYGFSEARDIPRALYVSTHKAARRASKDSPIIADLAGKRRNQYTTEKSLERLLKDLCEQHSYAKRVSQFLLDRFRRRNGGAKKRARALCLKLVHALDGDGRSRRTDVVQKLLADASGYKRAEVDEMIRAMHTAGLVQSVQGPYSTVTIT